MLDIKFIRDNQEFIREGAKKKHIDFDLGELLRVDDTRRELLTDVEEMRARQNEATTKISAITDDSARSALIGAMKNLKEDLQKKEEQLKDIMGRWQSLMLQVPNIPDISVPEGVSDADNQELRVVGDIPAFSFAPQNHIDLMQKHDMVDFERGTKVSGFRGYFLKNDGALLSFALWHHTLDLLMKRGFQPMIVPSMVRREQLLGTGYVPQGEDDLYKTQDGDYLAGTAEVATMGYFMGDVLKKEDIPKKFVSFSPCFRREAGSHGKDAKGLYRVHEFFKLEQVILCEASHVESVKFHEELTANAEDLIVSLGLPYRVVVNCGGDLGLGQVKKYDIEVWVPSDGKYRESHSSSYFHDFQTRRLNIKYRDENGKLRFVHSLNNTAVATPRILISIIENYQREDGAIVVPEVLRRYMGKDVIV
ncbi:MAG: serine--tRNA ligase [Candidatus Yonathbacteria bacterium CG_4_10_14_3_um_filter_47_65]|uniref:Serine--tRNA ligase n=2 Tax=Parcubacteria group TaxID=1794811 RepID=A0A2M8D6Y5_9BACT|nr:MAG: serine--tRNA ligase [Candidatus Nomurabacteria bacterium CG1_02_47_685]PIP04097.1 MAG: serine--tRNA ligase [Candidatus Yonathbacteria bacterium CG23_combo_of_CG06-09_8_20_14_all_46_18]PIQ30970.1 MAG: serine--tRNA ligase [Candidatus Yonathbacteria bacterium CG17_big_fil_post_rev_8_21_14_2_50_46_19]PIX56611.1 MAG: serine--tRNA ligase [Candidatus Yonathbacteria bacterium CG_4_10_14_3_um_filter_47_65]PIY57261.1 MAG: serine--tRNA ligase [Candidatus Yonathbacteria bacterium CG_4_10_14_0_8_um_